MAPITVIILFLFGIAIGSFLNVVILRYDGEHFLLDAKMIGGRSHCPHCKATLRWFELVPLASYLAQGGRCRRCGARLTMQYPVVELLSGFVFALVPFAVGVAAAPLIVVSAIWIAALEALLAMAVIDIRLGIIPDEINIFLGVLGVFLTIMIAGYFGPGNPSLIGPSAAIFGLQWSAAWAHVAGAVFGGAFFAFLIAITRGRGMGMGDLKLAIPLGLLFGWPDIILALVFAFVLGAAAGVLQVALGRNTMKGTIPFGPFLALGAGVALLWGPAIVGWYLSLLGAG
ncbi:MAG TPA: prepilin peptidase [Candidatus Paceibacterota bacterium]|nr:prepilin peptidase [Candidatus Paceibacterota bacterium]